jgi:hypothetical protein
VPQWFSDDAVSLNAIARIPNPADVDSSGLGSDGRSYALKAVEVASLDSGSGILRKKVPE